MSNLILVTCLLVLATCTPRITGPNYNQGRTHNQSKDNRMSIVYKEDIRMKKAMIKARKSASPKKKKGKSKKNKRIIR
jgi:hypothetical protein